MRKAGAAAGGDPDFANVVYVSNLQGANGGATFTDSSSLANAMSAVGNAQTSTAQFKWGNSSALFDGTGDSVNTASGIAAFNFNGVAFTVEAWVYRTKNAATQTLVCLDPNGSSGGLHFGIDSSNALFSNNGLAVAASGGTVPASAWTFLAVSSNSAGNLELYIDTARVATATQTPANTNGRLSIGNYLGGSSGFGGNIGALRLTNGVRRYTGATIVVPAAQFPTS
jgi:hypothetical protein